MDLTLVFTVLGIIVTAIVPFIGYIYKKRKEFRNYYSVIWKDSSRLKAKDLLGERPYEEFYFERGIDSFLNRCLERNRNSLVVGPPLSGKTRAVFHSLKNMKKSANVLVPRSVAMPSFELPHDYMFWKKKIVFIDDLQYYIEKEDNYQLLFREAKNRGIPVIATCHSGREFKKVKNKLIEHNLDLDTLFGEDIIELEKISADEGKHVADKLGLKWDNVKFNGTIGSIFMRLSEMEKRYDQCDTIEKTVLLSIRSLYLSGIYDGNSTFKMEWVKKAAANNELEGKDFEWNGWLKTLEDKEFVKIARKGKIWAEDAYLEYVVKPDVDILQLEVIEDMADVFADDTDVLQMIGERAYDVGSVDINIGDYMRAAIKAFEKILTDLGENKNEPAYIKAQNYLGQAYWRLSKVQDTLENCRKAIGYFNEVLKVIDIRTSPVEYAKIKNRIGNTFTAFAEVENKEQNCLVAIESYNEALKVFTIDKEPFEYARVCNNLGGAYLTLAAVKNSVENYKKAIASFNESLKVRTLGEHPKDYAFTRNNVGNSYARLSDHEEPEKNLRLAIEAYEDILKIYTADRLPLQHGLTMNNIGNAYAMLSMIKDKKVNGEKAIAAFEKALEVRTEERMPIQFANTIYNLGDTYLVMGIEDNNAEYLDKAIECFNEAVRIKTRELYPNQYAEVQYGLGRAYIKLAGIEDKSENYHRSIKAFDEALEVITAESQPELYSRIQDEISQAKKIFF